MTARVTTLKGPEAGTYYVEALPGYYLGTDEPTGLWHGRGAELLGLAGEVRDEDFLRIMAGHDPRTVDADVPLGRPYTERSARGFDVTASAPKSVSVLFAVGDDEVRAEVLAAHDAAVTTMVDWIEQHAHTRRRIARRVSVVDAEGIIAATFRQHTSRALDPQLHTHVVIANRVRSDDGRWLALDARNIKLDQRTLSAIYHAALRSELTSRLRVAWDEPVNGVAELRHMSEDVRAEFSSRSLDVAIRIETKLARFRDTFEREPTQRERWKLEREAVADSRPAKSKGAVAMALHAKWPRQLGALGYDPATVVERATGNAAPRPLTDDDVQPIINAAMRSLAEQQSWWRSAEITRELAAALPTDVAVDCAELGSILDQLTDWVIENTCVDISRPIPDGAPLRRDGRPITESVADRALTTEAILKQERKLVAWADRRRSRPSLGHPTAATRSTVPMSEAQAQVAEAVAGNGDLVLVVGPAGTGKTTALAPAVQQLTADGRPAFGLAPSAAAAEVLATETGIDADTIDRLLLEHRLDRPPLHRYDLPTGTTVIVDEAAMASTSHLSRLAALADRRGWRIVLVGDPLQFSAVGRGGMFELLTETCGAIELDRVHRFAEDWERDASLRIRRGDPSVAELYYAEGRLHGGTIVEVYAQALDAWWQACRAGESVVLAAPSNDTVAELNRAAQQRRLGAGELDAQGWRFERQDGARFYVGDEIVTRRNHREITTDRAQMIRNRDRWTVEQISADGRLTVSGPSGTVTLPAHYAATSVELGYATTSHGTQGRTVDRSIVVLDQPADVRGVYVPMTRGRKRNDAYIVTDANQAALDVFADAIARSWIDRPATVRQAELAGNDDWHPGLLDGPQVALLWERKAQLQEVIRHHRRDLRQLPTEIEAHRAELREAKATKQTAVSNLAAAEQLLAKLDRPLRRRRHADRVAATRTTIRRLRQRIEDIEEEARSLTAELAETQEHLDQARAAATSVSDLESELADADLQLAEDLTVRAHAVADGYHYSHALAEVGPLASDEHLVVRWIDAAARVDQHHSAFSIDEPASRPKGRAARGQRLSYAHTGKAVEEFKRLATPSKLEPRRPPPSRGLRP